LGLYTGVVGHELGGIDCPPELVIHLEQFMW